MSDMASQAADLARCLARDAEAVCHHYLSNGRRRGRYWVVCDVANTPGRSLFVRLTGPDSGKGAAGKWTDAATGQRPRSGFWLVRGQAAQQDPVLVVDADRIAPEARASDLRARRGLADSRIGHGRRSAPR